MTLFMFQKFGLSGVTNYILFELPVINIILLSFLYVDMDHVVWNKKIDWLIDYHCPEAAVQVTCLLIIQFCRSENLFVSYLLILSTGSIVLIIVFWMLCRRIIWTPKCGNIGGKCCIVNTTLSHMSCSSIVTVGHSSQCIL